MNLTTNEKELRYKSKVVLLMLYILSSDLSTYDEDEVVNFVDNLEGDIEFYFEPDFLASLNQFLEVEVQTIQRFVELKDKVVSLYAPQWHNKLTEDNDTIKGIRNLAKTILKELHIDYIEPVTYMDNHLEPDY